MVAIPKIISNKTVLTGLAQSGLKSSSVFKTAPAALDTMGKVAKAAPAASVGKISSFTADLGNVASGTPSGLSTPFHVPSVGISFR